MQISKTTRFNTCKKVAQLQRVIGVFSLQIEDRHFQKLKLNEIVDEKFAEMERNYREKIENDVKAKIPNSDELQNKYNTQFNEKVEKLKSEITQKSNDIQTKSDQMLQTLADLMNELSQISGPILEQTQNLIKTHIERFDSTKELLSQKVGDLKKVYKEEVKRLTEESENKENQFVVESRQKFDKMRSDHAVEMDNLRNEKPMPKLSQKELQQLLKQRERLKVVKETIQPLFDDAKYMLGSHRMFITNMKNKFKETMKIGENQHKIVDEKELERLRKEVAEQSEKFKAELDEITKKLDSLKAELTYKYERVKAEVTEQLRIMQEEFLKQKQLKGELAGQNSADLKALKEQNKKELNDLKEQFNQEELELTNKYKEKTKQRDSIKKANKSEKLKIKKELKALQTANSKEYEDKKNELNKIIQELSEKNQKEEKELQDQITALRKGGQSQENEQNNELQKLKQLLNDTQKAKADEISNYQKEIENLINNIQMSNDKDMNELQNNLNKEYQSKQDETSKEIKSLETKAKDEENDLRNKHAEQYNKEIEAIKQQFATNNEDDESIVKLKNEYNENQDIFQSIKTPNPSNNDFINLNATIDNLQQQIEKMKANNDKERENILLSYQKLTEEENKRHQETFNSNSGRGRDQVKQSLRNKINEIIAQREEEEKRLRGILDELEKQYLADMEQKGKEKAEIESGEMIEKLKSHIKLSENEGVMLTENAINNKNQQIEEMNQRIKELQETQETLKTTKGKNIDIETETFVPRKKDLEDKLEDMRVNSAKYEKQYIDKLGKNVENKHISNEKEFSDVEQAIENLKIKIQKDKSTNEMFINDNLQKCADGLKKEEADIEQELHKLQCNKKGLLDFYEEKIAVLQEELDKLAKHFDITAPRECDLETISSLEKKLGVTSNYLKTLLQEFMQMKSLIVSREREYNQRFGCVPKIGTVSFKKSSSTANINPRDKSLFV